MLSPDYLRRVAEGAEEIAAQLHAEFIQIITEAIVTRMRRGVSYRLTARDRWMLEVLQAAGYIREDLVKEIAAKTRLMRREIRAAFEDAAVRSLSWDDAVYLAAGLQPAPFRQSPMLQRIMERGYEKTAGEWENFTGTTADASQRLFIRECDKAYNLVMSGGMSHAQAVRQAVEAVAREGVTVKYTREREDGTKYVYHTDTIETATARAVRTGVGQACGEITLARMEEMDWPIVLVSAHLGARTGDGGENFTNHFWLQGKFYRRDVDLETIRRAMENPGRSLQADQAPGGGLPLTGAGERGTVQSSETAEPDIQIGRSLGAAARKQRVRLPDGSISNLTEGSKITKVVTFAGKGTSKPIRDVGRLVRTYKAGAGEWKKVRGDGYVDVGGISKHAELHWYETKMTGRVEMKVKRWMK